MDKKQQILDLVKEYIIEKRTEPKPNHFLLNMESPEGVKMVPKVNMIPTIPKLLAEQVQIFSTQKVLANLPSFMFDK